MIKSTKHSTFCYLVKISRIHHILHRFFCFRLNIANRFRKAFDSWNKGNSRVDHLLSARLRLQTNNFMDWIGLAIARHQLVEEEVSSSQKNKQIKNYPVQFSYHFYSNESIMENLQ